MPPGEVGHLTAKGPTGCRYLIDRNDEERLLALQKKMVKDGWNQSGDMAYLDEEGFIFFASREDDMIKSGGFRIYPGEIEEVLMKHPRVTDVCVFGVPDPTRGQNVVACLVAEEGVVLSAERREGVHLPLSGSPGGLQDASDFQACRGAAQNPHGQGHAKESQGAWQGQVK